MQDSVSAGQLESKMNAEVKRLLKLGEKIMGLGWLMGDIYVGNPCLSHQFYRFPVDFPTHFCKKTAPNQFATATHQGAVCRFVPATVKLRWFLLEIFLETMGIGTRINSVDTW